VKLEGCREEFFGRLAGAAGLSRCFALWDLGRAYSTPEFCRELVPGLRTGALRPSLHLVGLTVLSGRPAAWVEFSWRWGYL
jgi:hypothetical protein